MAVQQRPPSVRTIARARLQAGRTRAVVATVVVVVVVEEEVVELRRDSRHPEEAWRQAAGRLVADKACKGLEPSSWVLHAMAAVHQRSELRALRRWGVHSPQEEAAACVVVGAPCAGDVVAACPRAPALAEGCTATASSACEAPCRSRSPGVRQAFEAAAHPLPWAACPRHAVRLVVAARGAGST